MGKPKERTNSLIRNDLYTKFILKFSLIVLGTSLLVALILYLFNLRSTIIAFENTEVVVKSTTDFIFPILMQTVLVVAVLASLAGVLFALISSRRIASPLHKLKEGMEKLSVGDLASDYKMKGSDAVRKFTSSVDGMVDKLRDHYSDLSENWQDFEKNWQEFIKKKAAGHKKDIEQLNESIENISKKLKSFKIQK